MTGKGGAILGVNFQLMQSRSLSEYARLKASSEKQSDVKERMIYIYIYIYIF